MIVSFFNLAKCLNIIASLKINCLFIAGTFSYVYSGYFSRNKKEKLALKYIIPTSSPMRTKQEIECLFNIG